MQQKSLTELDYLIATSKQYVVQYGGTIFETIGLLKVTNSREMLTD